ncbi:hypothetical protein HZA33_01545 [Candidatus Pacearchaeota archaeon]|nr:hypothetical protein [Candidatus Pacearchaeota archaeon]
MTQATETKPETDINSLLRMMDVASALRKQREEVEKQLNIDEIKADLRKRILDTAAVTGEKLTEAEVDTAISNYLSGLYSFKEPKHNFAYKLASKYVDRARIWRSYCVPSIWGIAALAALSGTVKTVDIVKHKVQERGVEAKVEQAYQEKRQLENDLVLISSSSFRKQLPSSERTEVDEVVDTSKSRLRDTDAFFNRYCAKGSASRFITQSNYLETEKQLVPVKGILLGVTKEENKGKTIIRTQEQIVSTRQGLESLIREIRHSNPPKVLGDRAESVYQSGIASLENRQLSSGESYKSQLAGIKSDARQFVVLPSIESQLYASVKSTAREDAAKQEGEKLHNEAQLYIQGVDVPHLKQTVERLKGLDTALKQEYTEEIVSREGEKSGIDRYYTDSSGRRLAGYYLIVKAIRNGQALEMQIKNEEDGRTYTVDKWGERVPEAVYERVKEDKLDNGRVDDNVFARKDRGYLNGRIIMKDDSGRPLQRRGQITEW